MLWKAVFNHVLKGHDRFFFCWIFFLSSFRANICIGFPFQFSFVLVEEQVIKKKTKKNPQQQKKQRKKKKNKTWMPYFLFPSQFHEPVPAFNLSSPHGKWGVGAFPPIYSERWQLLMDARLSFSTPQPLTCEIIPRACEGKRCRLTDTNLPHTHI